ncbi:MAG: PIN domain-containing protein [Ferruginibacter sp.]|nr:PIN domain-containing protein [Cytophagales bacterium]
MNDKVFLDTNVLIYSIDNRNPAKKASAISLLEGENEVMISTQVIGEFVPATVKKGVFTFEQAAVRANGFMQAMVVSQIGTSTILKAFDIKRRYGFAYFDCLIAATALESNCRLLYSEDLHHGQVVDTLTVINPFVG